jgi:hypothetical protein
MKQAGCFGLVPGCAAQSLSEFLGAEIFVWGFGISVWFFPDFARQIFQHNGGTTALYKSMFQDMLLPIGANP